MPASIDLTNQKFGRLLVIEKSDPLTQRNGKLLIRWRCRCDCGSDVQVLGQNLRSGSTQSCGCLGREIHTKHGKTVEAGKRTGTYRSWCGAKERCYNQNNKGYGYYGGRGIRMCDRWRDDYGAFLADMGAKPAGYTLERKDFNGNYEPDNCSWVPKSDQAKNRRGNHVIEFAGERGTLADWARRLNIPYETLRHQYRYDGVPFAEIVFRARMRAY